VVDGGREGGKDLNDEVIEIRTEEDPRTVQECYDCVRYEERKEVCMLRYDILWSANPHAKR